MAELGVHEGDDGVRDFQSPPSSHEGEIGSNEEERSMEPQAEEDVRNLGGLRNRKMKSSRPEEDVRCPSELGNGKEKSSRSGREPHGGVKHRSSEARVHHLLLMFYYGVVELHIAVIVWVVIRLVLGLVVFLCSHSFPGELFMNTLEVSEDLHYNILEMRIVETPLHSVRSVVQDGTRVLKLARHDFLLLRTAGDKWYKAEKHGPSFGQSGIHFNPIPGPGAETIRFQSSISVDFSLERALAILTDHNLDYSLWRENCWKYAHSRAEAILNSCMEIASNDNVRNELKKELENLMDSRRRMPNEVVDIVQDYGVLRGVLYCFIGVFILILPYFFKALVGIPSSIYAHTVLVGTFLSVCFVWCCLGDPCPVLLTYNLTGLASVYRWHFYFLSFLGFYIGWTVVLSELRSFVLETEKHMEDLIRRTLVSERGDLDITNFRPSNHEVVSMEDQRKSGHRGL